MLNTLQAILFDLDGTLLDVNEFIFQAFEHTVQHYDLPAISRDKIAMHLGGSLESIYAQMLPSHNCHDLCEIHRTFQQANMHLSVPFPHVETTLAALQKMNIRMAVVTTRSKRTSIKNIESAGISKYFEFVVSGEDVSNLKPHPEPIFYALNRLGVSPEHSVMVGDTEADVLAGKSAGTRTIGVTYGFGGQLIYQFNPDYVLDDIESLLQL
jgi:pyrophosphatase PpaX